MKRGIIIVLIVILLLIIAVGLYFIFSGDPKPTTPSSQSSNSEEHYETYIPSDSEDCLGPGEEYPLEDAVKSCCTGLTVTVEKPDSVSVAGECYWSGVETDKEKSICSNCGDGKCETPEDLCQCPRDCEESTYKTVKAFCDDGYDTYCSNQENFEIPEGTTIDLCGLC